MDKKLKKRIYDVLARLIHELLPSFVPFQEKTKYLWPGEKAWEDTSSTQNASLYIIFSPEYKGRDQFTIEIAWSRLRRFPELIRRPSLAISGRGEIEQCYVYQEASVRLPRLVEEESWVDVNNDNVDEAVARQFKTLLDYGVPFLIGVASPGTEKGNSSCRAG